MTRCPPPHITHEDVLAGRWPPQRQRRRVALTADRVPEAVHEDVLEVVGVRLRVYVLDDGRCIMNADDVGALFEAFQEGAKLTVAEAEAMRAHLAGARL